MADAISQESSGSDGERRDACSETCPLSRDRRTGSKTTRRSVYSRDQLNPLLPETRKTGNLKVSCSDDTGMSSI
ncbi:uncharacterized protein LOC105661785 isoform X2 [Megachile rotundata]|uniref:uncharacterized protein LOC105661785 isoform X2 n=1 Tax=Megachile rotundata TaxID=143995 RepID=UPI003FCF2C4C